MLVSKSTMILYLSLALENEHSRVGHFLHEIVGGFHRRGGVLDADPGVCRFLAQGVELALEVVDHGLVLLDQFECGVANDDLALLRANEQAAVAELVQVPQSALDGGDVGTDAVGAGM